MLDPGTKAWVVSAIGKLMSQMGQPVGSMRDVLEKYASAVDVELRQVSTLCGMAYISTRLNRTRGVHSFGFLYGFHQCPEMFVIRCTLNLDKRLEVGVSISLSI